jgi:hypothetical protein
MLLEFKCSYDTIFQNTNFQVSKIFRKNTSVFIRRVFTILKLFITKFEIHMEKQKKINSYMNSTIYTFVFRDTILAKFFFFVSLCLF